MELKRKAGRYWHSGLILPTSSDWRWLFVLGNLVTPPQGRKLSPDFVHWRLCTHQRQQISNCKKTSGQCKHPSALRVKQEYQDAFQKLDKKSTFGKCTLLSRDQKEFQRVLTVCLPGLGAAGVRCEAVRQWGLPVPGQQSPPGLHHYHPLGPRWGCLDWQNINFSFWSF